MEKYTVVILFVSKGADFYLGFPSILNATSTQDVLSQVEKI